LSTTEKDFKVKNGIQVAGDGVFGGTISAATPTSASHLATKGYVDALAGGIPVDSFAPENPNDGDLWFDTLTERVNVYFGGSWITIATIDDTLTIPEHIHDTSIDGNGLIVTRFVDAGSFNDPQGTSADGMSPETTDWAVTFNGGIAIDNYN
jgi:hypothetical protein